MARGRRGKLTLEIQNNVCKYIRNGNYLQTAARLAGIHISTFHIWMNRGREEEEGIYVDFLEAVEKAESFAENQYLERIREAANGNSDIKPIWNAAAWYLERKYPDKWGRRERLDLKHSGKFDQEVKLDIFMELDKLESTIENKKKLEPPKNKGKRKLIYSNNIPI